MKIDRNIPIPPHGNRKNTMPFEEMQEGDSILVDDRGEATRICNFMRRKSWKCVTRQVKDGIRVWRI